MDRRLLLLALLGPCLAGCPTPVKPPIERDAGPTEFVGRACNVDAECGALRCDTLRRQCICLSDESCKPSDPAAAPRYCNNYTGLCVDQVSGCTKDSDCESSEFCDASIRTCRPLKSFCEPCAANSECGGLGDNCVAAADGTKACGKACNEASDCPRGAACVDKDGAKQCWPDQSPIPGQPASCKNYQGCTPDSLRTCSTTADCAEASQRCDPGSGKCVALLRVCPFGTSCDPRAKICLADCAVDADCGDPKLRCNNRVCEPVGDCTADAMCPANKVCNVPPGATAGTCVPFCAVDTDCPIGNVCQLVNGRYRCTPGCTKNLDCPLNQRCNAAKVCEGPTVGTARVCQATAACNSCELCDAAKRECVAGRSQFPFCQRCSGPAECTGGACVLLNDGASYCARFCGPGQDECPQGFVCLTTVAGQSACVPSTRTCAGKCP